MRIIDYKLHYQSSLLKAYNLSSLKLHQQIINSSGLLGSRGSLSGSNQPNSPTTPPANNHLSWSQAALMLNPDPKGYWLFILINIEILSCNLYNRYNLNSCWDNINEWTSTYITAMKRLHKRPYLPLNLQQIVMDLIYYSLQSNHFLILYSTLSFIYTQWYYIPESFLVVPLHSLLDHFSTLFDHWSYIIRVIYHHILVYIFKSLNYAKEYLIEQQQMLLDSLRPNDIDYYHRYSSTLLSNSNYAGFD